ncbi:MAG: L-threonylcarbamoyladenylate synthase [Bacteroidota bacterium]
MRTVVTGSPQRAATFILRGEIVAFPTETVYGLGANIFDEKALRKIFAAKKRPVDNPFIAHIAAISDIASLADRVPRMAEKFIEHFFPGPLTVVVPKLHAVPLIATAGLSTIGIRMPRHPVALSFLNACGVPLAAPSANLSGLPSPTTWRSVSSDLDGRISCILKGGQTKVGLESTVVDCTGAVPEILRYGAVTLEQLREIVPSTRIALRKGTETAKSPGMKYRHYSPRARVIIVLGPGDVRSTASAAYIGIAAQREINKFRYYRSCTDVNNYAHELFDFFRRCDKANVSVIYCQSVEPKGLGLALMDRLKRAAH